MVIYSIVFFALFYLVWFKIRFYALNASNHPKNPDNQMRIDPLYLFYCSLGLFFFLTFYMLLLIDLTVFEKRVALTIVIVFIIVLFVFVILFLRYFNWQITLFEDGFAYRNWLRQSKTYKFDSIKFISKINYTAVYQNDKCVLKVPRSAINFKEFIPAAKEYYKQHNIDKKKHIKYIWD